MPPVPRPLSLLQAKALVGGILAALIGLNVGINILTGTKSAGGSSAMEAILPF